MVLNRMSRGWGLMGLERLAGSQSLPNDPEVIPSPSFAGWFSSHRAEEESSKVDFRVEEGVVEIRDARLFREGQEPFCLALVEEMVRPGLARRAEIRLGSATCRVEFEPGRFDPDLLARKVASALKAATLRSHWRATSPDMDSSRSRWVTLAASASDEGTSILETLVENKGQDVSPPRPASRSPQVSAFSKRPLKPQPRRARREPPRARPGIASAIRPLAEPVRLALSARSILGKLSILAPAFMTSDPRRLRNLAMAGGSMALTIAGLVLPGIPALPFALLAGHYLVQSSPELCQRLGNVPGIGTLLQKASEVGGQVIDRKSLWKMFGLTVATVAAFVVLHPPLPVVMLLEAGIMAGYAFRAFRKPARTALASPLGRGMACLA